MEFEQTTSELLNVTGGVRLLIRSWLPEGEVKAVFLAIHGGMSHAGDYMPPALYFKQLGIATHALDLRWHGTYPAYNTGGKVYFHCENYAETIADIHTFYQWLKERYPHVPLFVLSHSNGALTALYYGLTLGRDADIKGFIISSPWIKNKVKAPAVLLALLRVIALLHPTWAVTPESFIDRLTHDKEIHARQLAELAAGLRGTQASPRLAVESQKTQKWVAEHLGDWRRFPLFAVLAGVDFLADCAFSQKALSKVPAELLQLLIHPGNFHENFNEINREETFAAIWRWLEPRLD